VDSLHSQKRTQQRCIPPLIKDLLKLYGDKKYKGGGSYVRYFSKKSRKKMNKNLGKAAVGQLGRLLNISIVMNIKGDLITVMRLNKRLKDK